jgi:hypothetical protein
MHRIFRHRLAIGAIVVVFAAAAGGAYAATQSSSSSPQAFVNDVAHRLNISPGRLKAAIQGALIDRLNAAVKDGRLTQAQANAIKQRIEHGGIPPFHGPPIGLRGGGFGGPPPFGPGGPMAGARGAMFGPMATAAKYLGITNVQLFNDLRAGHSLAQIAKSKGKSVSGLERAMTSAAKAGLDRAVAAGRLTKSQEQQILTNLSSRLRELVNRTGPAGPWSASRAPWGHPGGRGGPWAHPGGLGLLSPPGP